METREIECRGRRFRVRADAHAAFWDLFVSGTWEPGTIDVLERHLGPGRCFVDIGAWIGPLSLFALAMGSEVLAFEPDPVARKDLEENVALNPGFAALMTIDPRAVGSRDATVSLVGGHAGLGDSMSRVVPGGADAASVPVPVVDVRNLVSSAPFRKCRLLKCDVEGAEYVVIPRLREYLAEVGPPLLVSLHGYDLLDRPARRPRRLHLAWLHLVQGLRRTRLLRALDAYPCIYWSPESRATMKWKRLSRSERARLAVQLSESEMYCSHEPL